MVCSVATALSFTRSGVFLFNWEFTVLTGVLGFLFKIWVVFDCGQIFEMYVVGYYCIFHSRIQLVS